MAAIDDRVGAAKRSLRRRMLDARQALAPAARATAGRALREEIMGLPEVGMAGMVAVYFSTGTEPDTRGLTLALYKHGATVLLPVVTGDADLDWACYEGPESLVPGPRGTLHPAGERLGVDAVRRCDVIVVPALAVDARGVRLGRGGGSYDRALSRASPAALTVALLYESELLDAVPAEPHDRPVRAAALPSGVHRFAGAGHASGNRGKAGGAGRPT